MATQISAIDKYSVHKLCSGQVVLDLATAVKEIVENSIDSGATAVDIRFKDQGKGGFEVSDNGSGIDPADYESLALKHYTSKLVEFTDLEKVQTFGFRGEALSSLCALCHLTVTTCTKQQPMGAVLQYDMNGILVSQKPISRPVGTTVTLSDIFHSLPVRQREFARNIKKEYGNALTILQAYSIISTNVRITVFNQPPPPKKEFIQVMSTRGSKELITNISGIFGQKLASNIMPFKIDLTPAIGNGSVEGYISKPEWGIGRSSTDRQYFYVNGRPCILPKMAKTLNEIYRTYITKQYPVIIADFKVPTDAYEVNLSPDKRTIILHNELKIAETITEQLKEQFEPSRSVFELNPLLSIEKPPVQREESSTASSSTINDLIGSSSQSAASNSSGGDRGGESAASKSSASLSTSTPSITSNKTRINDLSSFAIPGGNQFRPRNVSGLKRPASSSGTSSIMNFLSKKPKNTDTVDVDMDDFADVSSSETVDITSHSTSRTSNSNTDVADESLPSEEDEVLVDAPEYIEKSMGIRSFGRFRNTKDYILKLPPINIDDIKHRLKSTTLTREEEPQTFDPSTLDNASFKNVTSDEKAAEALSRVISKSDFARMQVLGQFNLGFIIASLDEHDLYIVDQHAADEKYNFETLQKTTHLSTQKLLRPQQLDLTAAEELVVMDNLPIFEANGFGVEISPDNEPTKRIKLVSHMTSKNTVFDKHDFTELVSLISESPGEMVHCSRIRAMFASRACHKATRIGDSLTKKQMKTIVYHMGEIEQPWNCPHGRPTMRHLLSYNQFKEAHPAQEKRKLTFKGSLFNSQ